MTVDIWTVPVGIVAPGDLSGGQRALGTRTGPCVAGFTLAGESVPLACRIHTATDRGQGTRRTRSRVEVRCARGRTPPSIRPRAGRQDSWCIRTRGVTVGGDPADGVRFTGSRRATSAEREVSRPGCERASDPTAIATARGGSSPASR